MAPRRSNRLAALKEARDPASRSEKNDGNTSVATTGVHLTLSSSLDTYFNLRDVRVCH